MRTYYVYCWNNFLLCKLIYKHFKGCFGRKLTVPTIKVGFVLTVKKLFFRVKNYIEQKHSMNTPVQVCFAKIWIFVFWWNNIFFVLNANFSISVQTLCWHNLNFIYHMLMCIVKSCRRNAFFSHISTCTLFCLNWLGSSD